MGDAMMEQKLEYLHNNPVKRCVTFGLTPIPSIARFAGKRSGGLRLEMAFALDLSRRQTTMALKWIDERLRVTGRDLRFLFPEP